MLRKKAEREEITEKQSQGGDGALLLDPLLQQGVLNGVKTFAKAVLEPGASVGYHEHFGEAEIYYILSGMGEYRDNQTILLVEAGDVTITRSGEGHGIKNTGNERLEFIALIVSEK